MPPKNCKIPLLALAAMAFSLSASAGAAWARSDMVVNSGFHGGAGVTATRPAMSAPTVRPVPAAQAPRGSPSPWRGDHRRHNDVFIGIGVPLYYPYPSAYNSDSCWNSDYGFYGYWYNGYCYQYPQYPPY